MENGLDGAELSGDGRILYYSPLTSNYSCSIERQFLQVDPANDNSRSQRAWKDLENLVQPVSNALGSAAHSDGVVYMQDATNIYNTTLQADLT